MFRKNCLIIEDSKVQARIIMMMVSEMGWNVFSSLTLEHGLETLKREKVDLVLCDMVLPDNPELDAIARIRDFDENLIIAAMSAGSDGMDAKTALFNAKRDGAEFLLEKPFSKERLKEILETAEERAQSGGRRNHVLIIDEDEEICKLAKITLQNAGYNASCAKYLEEVMYKLDALDLDAIIIDIDNDEIVPKLAFPFVKEELPGVAIIAATSGPNVTLRNALNAGAETAITKPLSQTELLRTTQKAILLASANLLQNAQSYGVN